MFKIYGEPESPNKEACLRYMVNRNCSLRGVFKTCDEPESPNKGALDTMVGIWLFPA